MRTHTDRRTARRKKTRSGEIDLFLTVVWTKFDPRVVTTPATIRETCFDSLILIIVIQPYRTVVTENVHNDDKRHVSFRDNNVSCLIRSELVNNIDIYFEITTLWNDGRWRRFENTTTRQTIGISFVNTVVAERPRQCEMAYIRAKTIMHDHDRPSRHTGTCPRYLHAVESCLDQFLKFRVAFSTSRLRRRFNLSVLTEGHA